MGNPLDQQLQALEGADAAEEADGERQADPPVRQRRRRHRDAIVNDAHMRRHRRPRPARAGHENDPRGEKPEYPPDEPLRPVQGDVADVDENRRPPEQPRETGDHVHLQPVAVDDPGAVGPGDPAQLPRQADAIEKRLRHHLQPKRTPHLGDGAIGEAPDLGTELRRSLGQRARSRARRRVARISGLAIRSIKECSAPPTNSAIGETKSTVDLARQRAVERFGAPIQHGTPAVRRSTGTDAGTVPATAGRGGGAAGRDRLLYSGARNSTLRRSSAGFFVFFQQYAFLD